MGPAVDMQIDDAPAESSTDLPEVLPAYMPAALPSVLPVDVPTAQPISLEQRLDALERRLAALQEQAAADTRIMESRVAQRVLDALPAATVPQTKRTAGPTWWQRLNPFRASTAPPSATWLLWDIARDAQVLLAMLFDRRFGLTLTSKAILFVSLFMIFTSYWWFPLAWFWGIGYWIDKALNLMLAFFLFKTLNWEGQRYREFLDRGNR